jgi:hypothetical protein
MGHAADGVGARPSSILEDQLLLQNSFAHSALYGGGYLRRYDELWLGDVALWRLLAITTAWTALVVLDVDLEWV